MKVYFLALLFLMCSCSSKMPIERAVDEMVPILWERERLVYEGSKDVQDVEAALLFTSYKEVGLDESRRLMVATVQRLISTLEKLTDYPYSDDDFILSIQFKDENGNFRDDQSFVAEVMMKDEEIIYFVWDSEKGIRKKVYKERYDQAFGHAFGYPIS